MKIINIGIQAHVDAGKTTLTESLLNTGGAIAEQGSVGKGTTRTDTMSLERQRGITIQTAVASLDWDGFKINIVDTPGHMDFVAEVYRFEYGAYSSPVSTPADFRSLAPIVLELALKKAGTQLLEPYLAFTLFAPQEYLSRAYNDAPPYGAAIESTQPKNDEVVFTGSIPARCISEYRSDLTFYTNGRAVCLTELKGCQPALGEPVFQPRRPNGRLDKVRNMFQKIT